MQGPHGSASSTEWETDSDESEQQSPNNSKPGTPLARVDTLRSLSGPSDLIPSNANSAVLIAKARSAPQRQTTELLSPPQPQRRPPKPTRASRPPSSLSTKSTASVHPLLGLHPHIATTSSTTTSASPPINITSHLFPPLTASLSPHPHYSSPYYHEEPRSIHSPIPPYRPRTTSTLSSTSSSAISSLSHIPTRPPSPYAPSHHLPHHSSHSSLSAPQNTSNLIAFFPPSNPHLSLESIHPLLPAPYLGNHLTVLAKRAPLRESLERVRVAKANAEAALANGRR